MTPERKTLVERIRALQAKAENEASTEADPCNAWPWRLRHSEPLPADAGSISFGM